MNFCLHLFFLPFAGLCKHYPFSTSWVHQSPKDECHPEWRGGEGNWRRLPGQLHGPGSSRGRTNIRKNFLLAKNYLNHLKCQRRVLSYRKKLTCWYENWSNSFKRQIDILSQKKLINQFDIIGSYSWLLFL